MQRRGKIQRATLAQRVVVESTILIRRTVVQEQGGQWYKECGFNTGGGCGEDGS